MGQGSHVVTAVAWVAAAAWVRLLAWKLPHTMDEAKKKSKTGGEATGYVSLLLSSLHYCALEKKNEKGIVIFLFSSKVQFNSIQGYEIGEKNLMGNEVLSYPIIFSYYIKIFI